MTDRSLENRVTIVTGGSRGLGKVMAMALVQAGGRVLIVARSADEIAATVAEAKALGTGACEGYVGDVSRWEDCAAAVDHTEGLFGPVQVLINNAALGFPAKQASLPLGTPFPFWTYQPEDITAMVGVNLLGPFAMFHAVAPRMIAAGFGRVIGISTSRPTMRRPNAGAYGPIKAALEASTAIWAQELQGTGVTANILLPGGPTDTAFVPGGNVGARAKPFVAGKEPVGQEGTNIDLLPASIMAPPILWLASDQSNGVTGRRFVARDWDADLAPSDAARRAMQPPSDMPVIM
ncbi:3-oxoacyl-[acyl-carrier protein] reductase [Sphingomonas vulcanisoli]|uniref:3-oxoacyl-[acyl-carrier protein] reductase n=1 Tax=Sphingomonas vulcanisoli TaxID=1658060 RepID=A0ABX0TWK8_9SPHN|nr:SDR family oxidoreductase [Sphingomonas vulcanisoli]NIJ08539.1 3-oxoacyl-[acyl-carrier protein] reductase [Sphingomonas vulcanisoli]